MVVICITGAFKDLAPSPVDPDIFLAFSRTFVLAPVIKNTVFITSYLFKTHFDWNFRQGFLKCATEYQIINDLFSLTNPSDWQMQNSFKFLRNPIKKKDTKLTATDKEGLLIMFQEVTTLKTIWCRRLEAPLCPTFKIIHIFFYFLFYRLLDEGDWDFKRSIEIFLEEGQKNKIPATAFSWSI